MVPTGNKAKRLSSVNHTIKTIHHHHQFISKSSVHRLNKKKNLHCYKRLKTPQVNSTYRKRRVERAEKLLQRFSIHSLPRLVFQDKKDLSLQSPIIAKNNRVYFNGLKKDVQLERLYRKETNFRKRLLYPL